MPRLTASVWSARVVLGKESWALEVASALLVWSGNYGAERAAGGAGS
ncbi:hypothetical protein [Ochrobactrum sp. RH2CCR150]|nr:hypothetical protein [Ochrobactrum sp. RH2CCR150]